MERTRETTNHLAVFLNTHSFAQLPSEAALQAFANPSGVIMPHGVLVCVKVGMVNKGVPNTRARIYRLPAHDSQLKARWLSLNGVSGNKVCDNNLND
jgi:hypothetical protein